ncbi:MAG: transcriptional regulator [Flavobacteriales bacterium]|jgi:DNA-binding MarR family transcriptional regulator|nr:transcriptional regulator [Flavobacteriales bacterium]NCG31109.1 transcriptional regulator [Bacteroidota bacterium]MBT3964021.1 transcriptional regulator [Flavobacteriales bacterium]MBT4704515.1 transcriptional regulator [Flavobacteriales bacterium]MBT4931270.1 transcriptional regulator [Flavobacteriales bacterium]
MFKSLDPILHSPLRLAVMSLLVAKKEAEFTFIKEQTNSTAGNLSVQITKLEAAKYIEVTKGYKGKRPQTLVQITKVGRKAFNDYVKSLNTYINPE